MLGTVIIGLLRKMTPYVWCNIALAFVFLCLLAMAIASTVIGLTQTLNTKFTSPDCVEISHGNQQNTFALCFRGWTVQSCDEHNIDKKLYCAAYSESKLSTARHLSVLTSENSKMFHLDDTCLNPGRYALSNNETSHNPDDALEFYLLKDSSIIIELCSKDDSTENYTLDFIILDQWLAVDYFLNYSATFDSESIVANKSLQYREREGCTNYTIHIDVATFTYFTLEVHKPFAAFQTLRGFLHQYYYNASDLDIISEASKIGNSERLIRGDQNSILICTVPDSTFFQLCEKASFTMTCPCFLVITILGAVFFCAAGCCCFGKCLHKRGKITRRHNGYSSLSEPSTIT